MVVVAHCTLRSAQDSGGGSTGYVVGEINNKANSAQLELELGLSLANSKHTLSTFIYIVLFAIN